MYLHVDNCKHCNACIEVCEKAVSLKILNCKHCKDAPCVAACPNDAFFEAIQGVWSVNPEKCNACGLCAEVCPWDAIEIDGYARKCDLCMGDPKCMKVCPYMSLEHSTDEEMEIERILGWKVCEGTYKTDTYRLSYDEAKLIDNIIKVFGEFAKTDVADINEIIDEYCTEKGIILDERQRKEITKIAEMETRGFSILEQLVHDDTLEEIAIIGINKPIVVFKRNEGWMNADIMFTNSKKLITIINKIARQLGRRITMQNPRLNASLRDGSRLHAAIPPVVKEPVLTIRKFRKNPFTPPELIKNRTISADALAFLWSAMQCSLNIIIAGSTGSGKTTTLNVLAAFIPLDERIIIVEETPEINIPHKHNIRLVVNKNIGIGMNVLVSDTLRMRPDRLIVGEVRTKEEAVALINTMLAGQGKGSIATFHAKNAKEVLVRLANLGIQKDDLGAIDLIVVQRRWDRYDRDAKKHIEMRRITEISEVVVRDRSIDVMPIFVYDYKRDCLTKARKADIEERIANYLGIDSLDNELKRRSDFLNSVEGSFSDVVKQIYSFNFGDKHD